MEKLPDCWRNWLFPFPPLIVFILSDRPAVLALACCYYTIAGPFFYWCGVRELVVFITAGFFVLCYYEVPVLLLAYT